MVTSEGKLSSQLHKNSDAKIFVKFLDFALACSFSILNCLKEEEA